MPGFIYEKPFQVQKDTTNYRLLTKDYINVIEAEGRKILKVDPRGLELLAKTLGIPTSCLEITAGQSSRLKKIFIRCGPAEAARIRRCLKELAGI